MAWRSILIGGGALVAVLAGGGLALALIHVGEGLERGRWQTKAAEQAKVDQAAIARFSERSADITSEVTARWANTDQAQHQADRALYREIPHALPPETDARYPQPVGLIRLHDAAALGVPPVPDPAGRADDAASEVTSSGLGEAFTDNYGAANRCLGTLSALQDWVAGQAALATEPDR